MEGIPRALAITSILIVLLSACGSQPSPLGQGSSEVILQMAESGDPPKFAQATHVKDFEFPEDHGPHFNYQTEWWYYTGNLQTEDGQRFGYQFTVFRRALAPGAPPVGDGLATNQIYFAHLALTDASGEIHYYNERFSRGAAGLAGAVANPFNAWVEDWHVRSTEQGAESVHIQASVQEFELKLDLETLKPIVKHGNNGLSAKSDEIGNASYYLSYTRMETNGEIRVGQQTYFVSGLSWFDHEWSTSVLGDDAVGWDWFGLQLDDGRELMLYYIRHADGSIDPISGGTFVSVDGETINLKVSDVQIAVLDSWTSEDTGTEYPSGWQISLPSLGMDLTVEPLIHAQEMRVSFTYWEGAVQITGMQDGRSLSGSGFVELTGYLESMEGVLS
jgi:predicted secreted hydrolase